MFLSTSPANRNFRQASEKGIQQTVCQCEYPLKLLQGMVVMHRIMKVQARPSLSHCFTERDDGFNRAEVSITHTSSLRRRRDVVTGRSRNLVIGSNECAVPVRLSHLFT